MYNIFRLFVVATVDNSNRETSIVEMRRGECKIIWPGMSRSRGVYYLRTQLFELKVSYRQMERLTNPVFVKIIVWNK
jgi:hypothetical protein